MRSPPGGGATQVDVGIKVGPVQKLARVFGDRFWVWTKTGVVMSRTAALEPVPLTWENAFGGHDEAAIDTRARAVSSRAIPSAPDSASRWRKTAIASGCPTSKIPNQLIGGLRCRRRAVRLWLHVAELATSRRVCRDLRRQLEQDPKTAAAGRFRSAVLQCRGTGPGRAWISARRRGGGRAQHHAGSSLGVSPAGVFRRRSAGSYSRGRQETRLSTNLDTVIVNTDEQQLILLWRALRAGRGRAA